MQKWTIPNLLTASRLACVPFLLLVAWLGWRTAFIALLCLTLLTDALDGFAARRLHQESPAGARLDSWADFAVYLSMPICGWWLWRDIMVREAPFVIAIVASYVTPVTYGCLKYRRMTSYHTRLAKASAILIGPSVILLFSKITPWPLRVFSVVPVAACIEELAITTILPRWHANLPSFAHAIRLKRERDDAAKE